MPHSQPKPFAAMTRRWLLRHSPGLLAPMALATLSAPRAEEIATSRREPAGLPHHRPARDG